MKKSLSTLALPAILLGCAVVAYPGCSSKRAATGPENTGGQAAAKDAAAAGTGGTSHAGGSGTSAPWGTGGMTGLVGADANGDLTGSGGACPLCSAGGAASTGGIGGGVGGSAQEAGAGSGARADAADTADAANLADVRDDGMASRDASNAGGATSRDGSLGTGGMAGRVDGGDKPDTPATGDSAGATSVQVISDFTADQDGWNCGFSDYPQGQETSYELKCQQAPLPAPLGPGGGILMGGNNHSDDLFLYLARPIGGLLPATAYAVDVRVDIGTNAPADCGGIGGSPGRSVYFKIGASATEPASTLDSLGFLRLNLDKGNQSVGGADVKVVGDFSSTLICPDYTYQAKTLSLSGFSVRGGQDGVVWVVVGIDSGFEGITAIYYDRIEVTLTPR